MRTFLVLEGADALYEPGGEYALLTGSVMAEPAMLAWAGRALALPPGASLSEVMEAARAKGFTLYALPTRGGRADAGEVTAVRLSVGGREVTILRRSGTPDARVRWSGDDGRTREAELPAFLADVLTRVALTAEAGNVSATPAIASGGGPSADGPSDGSDAPTRPKSRRTKRADGA